MTVFTFAALALSACSQNGRLEDSQVNNDGGDGVVDGTVDGPGSEEVPSYPDLVQVKPVNENWGAELKKVINEVPHAAASGIGQIDPQNGSPDLPHAVANHADYEVSSVERPEAVKAFQNISVPSQDTLGPYVTSMEYVGYDVANGKAKVRITFSEEIKTNFSYVEAYKVVVNGAEVSAVNFDIESYNPAKEVAYFPIQKGQAYQFIVDASGIQDMQGNAGADGYVQWISVH